MSVNLQYTTPLTKYNPGSEQSSCKSYYESSPLRTYPIFCEDDEKTVYFDRSVLLKRFPFLRDVIILGEKERNVKIRLGMTSSALIDVYHSVNHSVSAFIRTTPSLFINICVYLALSTPTIKNLLIKKGRNFDMTDDWSILINSKEIRDMVLEIYSKTIDFRDCNNLELLRAFSKTLKR